MEGSPMENIPWLDISREINKVLLVHGHYYYELRDVERQSMLNVDSFLRYQDSYIKKYNIIEKIIDQNNNLILISNNVENISY